MLLLPPRGSKVAGATVWGVTAEAMDPKYEIAEPQWPGIVSGYYENEHPKQAWVNTAAVVFPVLSGPKRTLAANVMQAGG